ncbi:glycosyltransferase [Microbacterium dextranolyticum]|nr:glycosyltransferase [Microbacterium dextranolyticum]MBM7463746.1 glycosyltransferase involved in cell wall biosynthesis [Microbacterium dextranolyticum]
MNAETLEDPTVSIIVPVYNSGRYLRACVESIIRQTYTRLQIILINDGSTDESGAICDALARVDDRVLVVHQANSGIATAQNAGLDHATGDYITFCDNDDLMVPEMITRLVQLARESDADIAMCRWINVGASSADALLRASADMPAGDVTVFQDPAWAYQHVFSLTLRTLGRCELRYFSEANWGKLYRAALFDGLRFPAGRFAQDVAVAMPIYGRARRVASCSDPLYLWLQHGDSVSHASKSTSYYSDIVHAHASSFEAALSQGINPWRAAYGLGAIRDERKSVRSAADASRYAEDRALVKRLRSRLKSHQRIVCTAVGLLRRGEVIIYNLTVHRRS